MELARIVAEATPGSHANEEAPARAPVAQPRPPAPQPVAARPEPTPAAADPLDMDEFDRALSAELDGAVARLSRPTPARPMRPAIARPVAPAVVPPSDEAAAPPAPSEAAASERPAETAPVEPPTLPAVDTGARGGSAPEPRVAAAEPVAQPKPEAPVNVERRPADRPPIARTTPHSRATPVAPRPPAEPKPEPAPSVAARPRDPAADSAAKTSASAPPAAAPPAAAPIAAAPIAAAAAVGGAAPMPAPPAHEPLDLDWEPERVRKPATAGPVPTATDPVPFDFAAFEEELSASIGVEPETDVPPPVRGLDVDAFEADLLADLGTPVVTSPKFGDEGAAPSSVADQTRKPAAREPSVEAAAPDIAVEARAPAEDPLAGIGLDDAAQPQAGDEGYSVLPPHSRAERRAVRASTRRRRGRSGMSRIALAAAVVAVVCVGGAVYWLVGGGTLSSDEPQFIAAEDGPVKVAPPGSDADATTDPSKAFYDRVDEVNDPAKQALGRESIIIPPGEQGPASAGSLPGVPMPSADAPTTTATPAAGADEGGPKKVRTVIVRPDGTIIASPEAAAAQAPAPVAALSPNAVEPTTFETAAVDPAAGLPQPVPPGGLPGDVAAPGEMLGVAAGDVGTPMPARKPLVVESVDGAASRPTRQAAATPPPASAPPAPSQASPTPAPQREATAPAAAAQAPPAAQVPPAAQTTTAADGTRTVTTSPVRVSTLPQARADAEPAAPAESPTPPAATVATTPVATDRSSRVPPTQPDAAPAQPAAAPAEAAPAASGPFGVQLASTKSEAEAQKTFAGLQRKFPAILGGRSPVIQSADLGSRGVFYRIRVPAGTSAAANQLCTELKSAGGDCLVVRN